MENVAKRRENLLYEGNVGITWLAAMALVTYKYQVIKSRKEELLIESKQSKYIASDGFNQY